MNTDFPKQSMSFLKADNFLNFLNGRPLHLILGYNPKRVFNISFPERVLSGQHQRISSPIISMT